MTMSTFKAYSERSKARRALVQVYKVPDEHIDGILKKVDGKHGFYLSDDNVPCNVTSAEETAAAAFWEHNPPPAAPDMSSHDPVADYVPQEPEPLVEYDPANFVHLHSPDPKPDEPVQFRELDENEVAAFKKWARDNYVRGDQIDPLWHPAVRAECLAINAETAGAFGAFAFGQLTAHTSAAPPAPKPAPTRSASTKGQKIQKDRPIQNGVQLPSAGTLCRAVWDALQSMMLHDEASGTATVPTAQEIKAVGERNGWNANNVSIEYYRWRKFMGVTGRGKKNV
jgi:hypothetical protein